MSAFTTICVMSITFPAFVLLVTYVKDFYILSTHIPFSYLLTDSFPAGDLIMLITHSDVNNLLTNESNSPLNQIITHIIPTFNTFR